MKEYFENKGHLILKCLINQFAMSIFGVFMATTALSIGDSWLLPFGLFALLFFYFILFTFIREDGQKDAIKHSTDNKNGFSSLIYCGLASIPGFFFALLNVIFYFLQSNGKVLMSLHGIFNIVTRVFAYGMYNPIDTYLFNSQNGIFSEAAFLTESGVSYLIYTLFTLLICYISYNIGLKGEQSKK